MSKSNATETDMLEKIFKATAIPWDAAANLEIHLHTANPDEAGITTTSEATYTGYSAGQPYNVVRTGSGWSVSGNTASNVAAIEFGLCSGGTNAITYVSISPTGSTQILYSGALTGGGVSVSTGIQPRFAIGALTITED
jgi:hypothetical protein